MLFPQPLSSSPPPPPRPPPKQTLLEYKLVLMNKQEEVMVGLAHVPRRRYSSGIRITTVGASYWAGLGGVGMQDGWFSAAAAVGL